MFGNRRPKGPLFEVTRADNSASLIRWDFDSNPWVTMLQSKRDISNEYNEIWLLFKVGAGGKRVDSNCVQAFAGFGWNDDGGNSKILC